MDSPLFPREAMATPSLEHPTLTAGISGTGWEAFDRIYCITLADRLDRRQSARSEFARVGLASRVEFIVVERHPTDSEQGIFDSHMRCLREGLAAGACTIVVFEDDILFANFSFETLSDSVVFMKSDVEWDLFFLGCFVKSCRKTQFRSVVRIRYQCAAHAYVISRRFAEILITRPWQGIAYDDVIRSISSPHIYTAYPAFAFQNDSSSDNFRMTSIDRNRRLLGGMRRLQRWNEFSHRHAIALVMLHVAVILLIILLLLIGRT